MPELQSISVPNVRGFDFGVGVDRLSGSPCNQVVVPSQTSPTQAPGGISKFDVRRITSSKDLQTNLGINIEASYGCAAFGAGASARFGFLEQSSVHSSTLFMTVTATAQLTDLSIDESNLTPTASDLVGNQEAFKTRYGEMFCRACTRGGLFVAVLRFETYDSESSNQIEGELQGSYGLFSADVAVKFSTIATEHSASLYYSLYAEGGPALQLTNPGDIGEMLQNANRWMTSMVDEGDKYSRPYEWTLSPITIANGPLPPNVIDIQKAQDVLLFCATERTNLLDDINKLQWYLEHPDRFDWTAPAVTQETVAQAVRDWQFDLQTVAACASEAMNDAKAARLPAVYASEVQGRDYRKTLMPSPLPSTNPMRKINVVSLVGLRGSTINTILSAPTRSYGDYLKWCDSYYEPGQVAVHPSPEQYEFLASGIKVQGEHLTAGVTGFWSWVYAQTPDKGTIPTTATVTVTTKLVGAGYPPADLRPLWGL